MRAWNCSRPAAQSCTSATRPSQRIQERCYQPPPDPRSDTPSSAVAVLARAVSLGTVPSASSLAVTGSEGFVQTLERGRVCLVTGGSVGSEGRAQCDAFWLVVVGRRAVARPGGGGAAELARHSALFVIHPAVRVGGGFDGHVGRLPGNLFSQQRVTSYAQLLTGEKLAAQVVDDLGLPLTPAQVATKVTAPPPPAPTIL